MKRNRRQFEEYMNSLSLEVNYSDTFIVDNKIYQMLGDGYETREGVDIRTDKTGFSSVQLATGEILDFLIVLPYNRSSTYTLYYFNNSISKKFYGYDTDPNTGEYILDNKGDRVPLYITIDGSLDETLKMTMRQSETYLAAQPEEDLVFVYYCYLLIKKFLKEREVDYKDVLLINCK